MKQIPVELQTAYDKPGRSTAFLVKIVDEDGNAYGFTTLDDVVEFDDGFHNLDYDPEQELKPQNIEMTVEVTDLDNTELHGWFNDAVEKLMVAGRFGSAEITIYRIAYLNIGAGAEVIAFGLLGKVDYAADSAGKRKIEWLGLDTLVNTAQVEVFSLTCRNEFGDENCRKPLVWETGSVSEVDDANSRFRVTGISQADGYFNLGLVLFTSGDNDQSDREIETWTSDGWVTLSFPTAYNVLVGTGVSLRRDCDKTETACKAYSNIVNMDAEHLTPVQDQSLMIPGAYIKSSNSL